jgi:glycyl-tRNA synthetase alpha chain
MTRERGPTFQQIMLDLLRFWADRGCVVAQPYDVEVGAGTMNPETFLRVLGPEPWRVAYVEPSRRPADGRYGENPFRLEKHYQLQVIWKPSPDDAQDVYLESLAAIGIDATRHDLRFEEDDWASPTLGAWGVGWQVTLDGQEITQFTYFQQAGGIEAGGFPLEITYGLERISMFLQGVRSIYDIEWSPGVTYGQVRLRDEYEFSRYYFDEADVELHQRWFRDAEAEASRLLDQAMEAVKAAGAEEGAPPPADTLGSMLVLPAYDSVLRCSHIFNVLDARGAISVTERAATIRRIRRLACRAAECWLAERRLLGFPLLQGKEVA